MRDRFRIFMRKERTMDQVEAIPCRSVVKNLAKPEP